MPQDWQAVLNTLGFISLWSTVFHSLAYAGLIICTRGIVDKKRQAWLFLFGVSLLLSFALYGGDPIFIGAQSIIALASLMRVRGVQDAPLITFAVAILTFADLFINGHLNSGVQQLGSAAMLGLAFGVALVPKTGGNALLAIGGSLMTYYAYLVWSLPFLVLNIPFTIAALVELERARVRSEQKLV